MKQDGLRIGLLVGALCVWSCTQGRAADPGPYLSLDAGVNIVNDVDLDVVVSGFGSASSTAELNPGFRFSVAGGYRFTPLIGAEIETGFLANEVDSIGDAEPEDTFLSHIPVLANVVFRFENSTPFIPFIGAGAGGVASFFSIDDSDLGIDDDDSDFVFAWQVMAGVHYRINDNMSAGIVYKYLGVDSPEFEIEGIGLELDAVNNHAIMGSFNWSF